MRNRECVVSSTRVCWQEQEWIFRRREQVAVISSFSNTRIGLKRSYAAQFNHTIKATGHWVQQTGVKMGAKGYRLW